MRRSYIELNEHHIGALFKCTSRFGLITAVAETDTAPTIDSFVQFKPEGSLEILEFRIAAFEYPGEILKDIIQQIDASADLPMECCKCMVPAPDPKLDRLRKEAQPAPEIRCCKELQLKIAAIKRVFYREGFLT